MTCPLLDLKSRLLAYSGPCKNCFREHHIVLNYELLCISNVTFPGIICFAGMSCDEVISYALAISCEECDQAHLQSDSKAAEILDINCMMCFTKLWMVYDKMEFEQEKRETEGAVVKGGRKKK